MANKWDLRYLCLAKMVASWSKDPSTQTGAVIVRPDRTVVSVGFNGFPKAMRDSPERYTNREEKYSRIIHCEINALLHAHEMVENCVLYTWPFASCDRCVVQMIEAGIFAFVFPSLPSTAESRWKDSVARAKEYMKEAGCQVVEIEEEI